MSEGTNLIQKKDWLTKKYFDKTNLRYSSGEHAYSLEHLLSVSMGEAKLLIPGTPEYQENEGLETVGLSTCIGLALYVPYVPLKDGSVLGMGHLAPSQSVSFLIKQLRDQLRTSGVDFDLFAAQQGYLDIIRGQSHYDKVNRLGEQYSKVVEDLEKQFPNFTTFPSKRVSYSVLKGHMSSGVKLFKDGRLVIAGEGKAY